MNEQGEISAETGTTGEHREASVTASPTTTSQSVPDLIAKPESASEGSRVADTLNAAADLLEQPNAWTRGCFARRANGNPIGPQEDNAVCWCVSGAIQKVEGWTRWGAWNVFDNYVRRRFRVTHMAVWNDHPKRTQAEVVAALRQAAFSEPSQKSSLTP